MDRQAARVATPTTNVVEEESPQTQRRKRKREMMEKDFKDNKKRRESLLKKLPSKQGLTDKDIKFQEKFSTVSPRS